MSLEELECEDCYLKGKKDGWNEAISAAVKVAKNNTVNGVGMCVSCGMCVTLPIDCGEIASKIEALRKG